MVMDECFVQILCCVDMLIVFVVNKVEGYVGDQGLFEVWNFGLGEFVGLFGVYGEGLLDLYVGICDVLGEEVFFEVLKEEEVEEQDMFNYGIFDQFEGFDMDDLFLNEVKFEVVFEKVGIDDEVEGEVIEEVKVVIKECLICFVIVGCFNVGKLILINQLVGEECMFIGLEVGII